VIDHGWHMIGMLDRSGDSDAAILIQLANLVVGGVHQRIARHARVPPGPIGHQACTQCRCFSCGGDVDTLSLRLKVPPRDVPRMERDWGFLDTWRD
jgi:hypothetical protein